MNVQKKNLKYSSVYFIRFLRRHNEKKINAIADKCLMCDKCHALCPVGVDAPALRRAQRATVNNTLPYNYAYLDASGSVQPSEPGRVHSRFAAAENGLSPESAPAGASPEDDSRFAAAENGLSPESAAAGDPVGDLAESGDSADGNRTGGTE